MVGRVMKWAVTQIFNLSGKVITWSVKYLNGRQKNQTVCKQIKLDAK